VTTSISANLWRSRYVYRGNVSFDVIVSDAYGDPGTVPVIAVGNGIIGWAFWVHVTCRVTAKAMDAWRLLAWEAMRDGHAEMRRAYEETLAAAAVQAGITITGRNPTANARIVREEIQRQCISAFANASPGGNNGLDPGGTTVDWPQAYGLGLYARFMHNAFEWENVSYVFYPYFWARTARWLDLFNVDDADPEFQAFLQAGMTRVVVPVRPGFESHVEYFCRTGTIWSGEPPPLIGDPDFLSVVAEIRAQTGAPGAEEPVSDPWEIVVPTQLVALRTAEGLPSWRRTRREPGSKPHSGGRGEWPQPRPSPNSVRSSSAQRQR
jgi:hypothetical protein